MFVVDVEDRLESMENSTYSILADYMLNSLHKDIDKGIPNFIAGLYTQTEKAIVEDGVIINGKLVYPFFRTDELVRYLRTRDMIEGIVSSIIRKFDPEVIASREVSGEVYDVKMHELAKPIADRLGIEAVSIERNGGDKYFVKGDVDGKRVLLLEDVIGSGDTKLELIYLINNNTVEAKKYFGEAIAKISDNKEKYKLWKLWCRLAQNNNNDVLELEARKKLFKFGDESELVHINELFKRMINYKKLIAYNTEILNSKTAETPEKIIIDIACKELFSAYLHLGDTNTAWEMVSKTHDYNYLMNIAEQLDKIDEIAPKFVEEIQKGNSDEIAYLARRLGNYYNKKNDPVSMNRLISIIMERTPEFKPSSYKEISNFYLAVGMTNDAIKILEKYGETADRNGKDYVKRRVEVLHLMTK